MCYHVLCIILIGRHALRAPREHDVGEHPATVVGDSAVGEPPRIFCHIRLSSVYICMYAFTCTLLLAIVNELQVRVEEDQGRCSQQYIVLCLCLSVLVVWLHKSHFRSPHHTFVSHNVFNGHLQLASSLPKYTSLKSRWLLDLRHTHFIHSNVFPVSPNL